MSLKKSEQLGMGYSKANYILVKDILFSFSQKLGYTTCMHCGKILERDTFSIEHKIPWQDAINATELFFSLDNICFSHKKCNSKMARRTTKKYSTKEEIAASFNVWRRKDRQEKKELYSTRRKAKYKRTGK